MNGLTVTALPNQRKQWSDQLSTPDSEATDAYTCCRIAQTRCRRLTGQRMQVRGATPCFQKHVAVLVCYVPISSYSAKLGLYHLQVCVCVCIYYKYTCMYIYIYVCICICIYMHRHKQRERGGREGGRGRERERACGHLEPSAKPVAPARLTSSRGPVCSRAVGPAPRPPSGTWARGPGEPAGSCHQSWSRRYSETTTWLRLDSSRLCKRFGAKMMFINGLAMKETKASYWQPSHQDG